jgi:hypothetical protein
MPCVLTFEVAMTARRSRTHWVIPQRHVFDEPVGQRRHRLSRLPS